MVRGAALEGGRQSGCSITAPLFQKSGESRTCHGDEKLSPYTAQLLKFCPWHWGAPTHLPELPEPTPTGDEPSPNQLLIFLLCLMVSDVDLSRMPQEL